jgi:virulence factor Mce-like protein
MSRARRTTRRALKCAAAITMTTTLSGCAFGLESLPLAGPSSLARTYSLTATFANALNLPAKAKVKLNGADIGEVESINARNFTAYVSMSIRANVALPVGTSAELRSATPLGDLFVAVRLDPNQAPSAAKLRDGDTIPLESTSSGATIEQVLSSAALLVNGGVVKNITSLLNGAGQAIGGDGENISTLLRQSNEFVSRLNSRSAQMKTALQSTSDLAATLADRQDTINEALAAAAPATGVLADNTSQLADLVTSIGRITGQLSRFPSVQGTDTRSLIGDLNRLSKGFNDVSTDPNLSLTPLNRLIPIVMKSTNSAALHGTAEVWQLAFGSLPDLNYPGDPQFHGPDGTDWHAMVGSLRYEWNLLLDKIYGPNR